MGSKLFLKVSQREERVDRIKAFLVLPVAALHFAIMPGRVRAHELVMDTKIKGGFLKKGLDIPFALGETIRACLKNGKYHLFVQNGRFQDEEPQTHTCV